MSYLLTLVSPKIRVMGRKPGPAGVSLSPGDFLRAEEKVLIASLQNLVLRGAGKGRP